jgi:hypothetical protein
MRPTVIVLGFILGSAAAITFALGGTTIVFLVLRGSHPRLEAELGELLINVGLFLVLTAAAAVSFFAEIKGLEWRGRATAALVAAMVVVVTYQLLR